MKQNSRPRLFALSTRTFLVGVAVLAAVLLVLPASWTAEPTSDPDLAPGQQLVARHRWEKAESWFYDFVKAHPQHAGALRELGLVELRRPGGDKVRARQYLERAAKIEPDNPIGMFLLAKAYEVGGDATWGKAKEVYQKLVDMGPGKDDPTRAAAVHLARFNRALMAKEEGDLDKARGLLMQVVGREPQHAYATYELGLIAVQEGDLDAAREWFEKAVQNVSLWAPTEAWPYPQGRYGYVRENAAFELGRLLMKTGEMERAREVLEPISKMVEVRAKAKKGHTKPPPKAPLEGIPDLRFEDAPFYYAETLVAAGRTKEAITVLKNFSRMRIGDKNLRAKARSRAKKLR